MGCCPAGDRDAGHPDGSRKRRAGAHRVAAHLGGHPGHLGPGPDGHPGRWDADRRACRDVGPRAGPARLPGCGNRLGWPKAGTVRAPAVHPATLRQPGHPAAAPQATRAAMRATAGQAAAAGPRRPRSRRCRSRRRLREPPHAARCRCRCRPRPARSAEATGWQARRPSPGRCGARNLGPAADLAGHPKRPRHRAGQLAWTPLPCLVPWRRRPPSGAAPLAPQSSRRPTSRTRPYP
jgi:hypothetical protein